MLTREKAREQLEAFAIPDWKERRLAAVGRLPRRLQRTARSLLDFDVQYYSPDYAQRYRTRQAALQAVDEMGADARAQLFRALFPRLADEVEAGWQLTHRLPYQRGEQRRAFRAPQAPEVTRARRLDWLDRLLRATASYEPDARWLAMWAAHLGYGLEALGTLFAAAIDQDDEDGRAVYDILLASARGEHPIGAMGRHVTRGLLSASRPEGWEFVEGLLLAAQRQEGLRQVVLETIDEAHPQAFERMLRLIVSHDLTRFSAALRAAGVWFGFAWADVKPRQVTSLLERAVAFLESPEARQQALTGDDAEAGYMALWAQAFFDAPAAVEPAARLLADPRPAWRLVGAHALAQFNLRSSMRALAAALNDDDLQVAGYAFTALRYYKASRYGRGDSDDEVDPDALDLFDDLERLLARCPREAQPPKPLVWPWLTANVKQADVAAALPDHLHGRPLARLLPHLLLMASHTRAHVAAELAKHKPLDAGLRAVLFQLLRDPSRWVREVTLRALHDQAPREDEARDLEALLVRKSPDLRRGVIELLLRQADAAAFDSTERLLAGRPPQRLAGLELLEALRVAGRKPETCQAIAREYRARSNSPVSEETARLERILGATPATAASLEDALGLMDPSQRTPPTSPRNRIRLRRLITPAAIALRQSLDALIDQHRDTPVIIETPHGSREVLLGQLDGLANFDRAGGGESPGAPLADVWERWWAERPRQMRDRDGLEIVQALAYPGEQFANPTYRQHIPAWLLKVLDQAYGPPHALDYPGLVRAILTWLLRRHPVAGAADCALDGLEETLALVPPKHLIASEKSNEQVFYFFPWGRDWRSDRNLLTWRSVAQTCREVCPEQWTAGHQARLWGLLRWLDEPAASRKASQRLPRNRAPIEEIMLAVEAGAATEADLLDCLLGGDGAGHDGWHFSDGALAALSGRRPNALAERYPYLGELIERCRRRVVAVELTRGDRPTAASATALSLRWSGGLQTLVELLAASGPDKLVRGHIWGNASRDSVFSHLIRVTFPAEADTPEAFARAVRRAGIAEQRLIELALFAPHWAGHVEHALGWPGLAAGVWWLHAHTKDRRWHVGDELRDAWAAEIGEHTPLSAQDLLDGAVDVAWFQRTQAALEGPRWEALYGATRYTSGGQGHSRARLFADAMTGRIARDELTNRIRTTRNQDAVRALGLLPLADGEADLLERYSIIQAFRSGTRKFGSQRQASEKLAARIGLENLARTAGYTDPVRLEWAMEARSAGDLAAGPLTAEAGGVAVALTINELGEPALSVKRGERQLKTIPARIKKEPAVAALLERRGELEQQKRRVRQSLEAAMCRGDSFTAEELRSLMAHPVLAAMLSQLVFIGDAGLLGYLMGRAVGLEGLAGAREALPPGAVLRLAHPIDLLHTGRWSEWQHECFIYERVQPFKQVFRELYVLTRTEHDDSPISRRYAGHQVNPRQAMALFTARGWLAVPAEGVRRTFHAEGLSAWLSFLNAAYTPAEVEGLTLEGVLFHRVGELLPMPLADVPPRVFSEVMRDLDLVVSVAHRGGVDPEASASTVEMRATLVRETCALLKLDNVRLQNTHVLVDGKLGHYSVHLGSAGVHRLPGGALCIIPVHAQHRGRLFLPFADDDPKTAEVMSKVLLLARDDDIKDPSILEQILARA
jgi:hypothetical protein